LGTQAIGRNSQAQMNRSDYRELVQNESLVEAIVKLHQNPLEELQLWAAKRLTRWGLGKSTNQGFLLNKRGRQIAYQFSEYLSQRNIEYSRDLISRLDITADHRVLDIGCGMGQSLVALSESGFRLGVGVDCDLANLEMFSALRDTSDLKNLVTVGASAEELPFQESVFDRILCRVTLMYVNVPVAIKNISRVAADQALLYLHLTDAWFYLRKLLKLNWEGGGVPFALVNGLLLQSVGLQIQLRTGRTFNYQTVGTVIRLLKRNGFEILSVYSHRSFRPTGSQPKILARRSRS